MERRLLATQLLLLAALLMTLPATGLAQGLEIRSIQVNGRENLEFDTIVENMDLEVGDVIQRNTVTVLEENAQQLYDTGLFQEKPVLELEPLDRGVMLVVNITENPTYQGIVIQGNSLVKRDKLLEDWSYEKGKVIDSIRVNQELTTQIEEAYRDADIASAFITDVRVGVEGEDRGKIFINILEGKLDEIKTEGNTKTKDEIIKQIIRRVEQGEVIRLDDLIQDVQDLQNSGLFSRVDFNMEPSVRSGFVNLIIEVQEARTGQLGFGAGYSTVNGLSGTVSLRERNWKGEGKNIGGNVTVSARSPGFQLDYSDQYISDKNSISFSLFNTDTLQRRNSGSFFESELVVNTVGGSFNFGRRLAENTTASIGVKYTDFNFDVLSGDPFQDLSPARRAQASRTGQTMALTLGLQRDTRDNVFSPSSGYMRQINLEIAGFGGDFNFQKGSIENRNYFPVGNGTLAFREMVGVGEGDIPLFEEFRLGGVNSVRGFQEDEVTGTRSVLLNGEYRFPLGSTDFTGAVFLDAGFAGESFGDMERAVGTGVGIRFRIPALGLGAIRLDYGIGLAGEETGSRFHFGIGEMF